MADHEVYKGNATHTRNNVECVKWSSFSNGFSNAENNICIKNGEDAPWCYIKTQKTGAYWDYCSCALKQGQQKINLRRSFLAIAFNFSIFILNFSEITDDTCINSASLNVQVNEDQIYAGTATKTIDGDVCVKWSEVDNPHYEDDHNFCRSTWKTNQGKPWCYTNTEKTGKFWGFCSCAPASCSSSTDCRDGSMCNMDNGSDGGFCEPCTDFATADDCDDAGFNHVLGAAECKRVCLAPGKVRFHNTRERNHNENTMLFNTR